MRNLIAANPFGIIKAPEAIEKGYGVIGGGGSGLTGFISNLIVLITLIAGIWTLFNVLLAGFSVITAEGDPKKLGEMGQRISSSFLGLLIMVSAPLLAGLIGLFFFGDALTLLKPTITGVGQ